MADGDDAQVPGLVVFGKSIQPFLDLLRGAIHAVAGVLLDKSPFVGAVLVIDRLLGGRNTPSITTTLPKFGQFLAGNRFAETKDTKLSSAWAGRHGEVLKAPFLRTVVVILGVRPMA